MNSLGEAAGQNIEELAAVVLALLGSTWTVPVGQVYLGGIWDPDKYSVRVLPNQPSYALCRDVENIWKVFRDEQTEKTPFIIINAFGCGNDLRSTGSPNYLNSTHLHSGLELVVNAGSSEEVVLGRMEKFLLWLPGYAERLRRGWILCKSVDELRAIIGDQSSGNFELDQALDSLASGRIILIRKHSHFGDIYAFYRFWKDDLQKGSFYHARESFLLIVATPAEAPALQQYFLPC